MPNLDDVLAMCRVKPGDSVKLKDFDPGWHGDGDRPKDERKRFAEEVLSQDVSDLAKAQDKLYASNARSILVVFQAMDAAGKDGTIKHVMSGINPQGCQVFSFKQPSVEELEHDFLWRYSKALPERGRIGIFNRSYYEDVLVVRVHPELVERQRIPDTTIDDDFWKCRFDDINNFERHLSRNGTTILKFFLHVSKDEQRKRFLKRLDDPRKHWKFSLADLAERGHWDDYMHAYEQAIAATNTKWAPWNIVPADHKWVTRAIVARVLASTIETFDLHYPEVTDTQRAQIEEGKRRLGEEVAKGSAKKKKKGEKKSDAEAEGSTAEVV
jgi:PPK2 family polyphosphate:nucleotide phosphotransferase